MTNEGTQQGAEQRYYPWQDGMPTGPDVDALMRAWPELSVGDRITYQDVERLTGIEQNTNRWRTVTNAWRKRLLDDHSLVVECEPGVAFFVASANEITAGSHRVLTHIKRTAKKQRRKLSVAVAENEEQERTIAHQGQLFLVMEREARKHRMNLLPSTKVPEQPRIKPPEKDES